MVKREKRVQIVARISDVAETVLGKTCMGEGIFLRWIPKTGQWSKL